MVQYINKAALVAEIKSRISDIEISQKAGQIKKRDADKKIFLFNSVLSLIDTLEVKEVDLDTDFGVSWGEYCDCGGNINDYEVAKHFFELGLLNFPSITEEDCKLIWNIGDDLPYMPEEDFFKELLKRYKAQKEE